MNQTLSTPGGRPMRILTATLAVGLWLCMAATAHASDNVPSSQGPQGLPGPGPSSPSLVAPSPDVAPSDKAPSSQGPQGLPGPGPSSAPIAPSPSAVLSPSDEGPSALTILLIALGGALSLTGVAYIITRTAQHRRAVS
jgi:hypothetical protein